jgi:hypothetical protein
MRRCQVLYVQHLAIFLERVRASKWSLKGKIEKKMMSLNLTNRIKKKSVTYLNLRYGVGSFALAVLWRNHYIQHFQDYAQ